MKQILLDRSSKSIRYLNQAAYDRYARWMQDRFDRLIFIEGRADGNWKKRFWTTAAYTIQVHTNASRHRLVFFCIFLATFLSFSCTLLLPMDIFAGTKPHDIDVTAFCNFVFPHDICRCNQFLTLMQRDRKQGRKDMTQLTIDVVCAYWPLTSLNILCRTTKSREVRDLDSVNFSMEKLLSEASSRQLHRSFARFRFFSLRNLPCPMYVCVRAYVS